MPFVRPLSISIAVTALVALSSYLLPSDQQSTGVGLCLLVATYLLVLRRDAATIRRHGLALGGIFEPVPLDGRRIVNALAVSVIWCSVAALSLFPPFLIGFISYWEPVRSFEWPPPPPLEAVLAQILGIAMPEEMFYRGYVQTALDDAFKWRWRLFGAPLGAGVILASVIFALGHFATDPNPARLSVFFPSLVFGWLRAKTGGVGAAVLFHAACNLFSAYITQGFFPG